MNMAKAIWIRLFLLSLSILMIASCIGIDIAVSTKSKKSDKLLTIKHHRTVQLDEARINKILREAESAMKSNGVGDYNCDFEFYPVVIKEFEFPDTPAIISSRTDWGLVAREARGAGEVMVVGGINWDCGGNGQSDGNITVGGGEAWGCSPQGGSFIVVEHQVADEATEGILWLHEFGHNGNLGHVGTFGGGPIGQSVGERVMNKWIDKNHTYLTQDECNAYRGES